MIIQSEQVRGQSGAAARPGQVCIQRNLMSQRMPLLLERRLTMLVIGLWPAMLSASNS